MRGQYRWFERMRAHGVVTGTRYTVGVLLLKPMLERRYKDATAQQKRYSAQTGMDPLVKAALDNGGVDHETWFALHDWRSAHGREAFNRGRMMEDLHVWRCDIPTDELLAEEVG
jgi:hypothetical protein